MKFLLFAVLLYCAVKCDDVGYSKKDEAYTVDVENLHTVEQVETPLCSASRLKEFEEDVKSSENLISTPTNLSMSPTNISLSPEDSSTLSPVGESLASSPIFNRTLTRKSFGWHFKKFQPENYMNDQGVHVISTSAKAV